MHDIFRRETCKYMEHTKLSRHTFVKGKFVTPLNSIKGIEELNDEKSWPFGRMPEYLWIGLLFDHYGRDIGLEKSCNILTQLHKLAPELSTARLSQIIKLEPEIQKNFYEYILHNIDKETLSPITLFLTLSYAPYFADAFYSDEYTVQNRCERLVHTMTALMNHQSHESTDVRFVVLFFNHLSGKMHLMKEQAELLQAYSISKHEDKIMRIARPTVRSIEMTILTFETTDSTYLSHFWRCISEMTDCNPFAISFPAEDRNITGYMEKLYAIFQYLTQLFTETNPLDEKMNVLLGIATYSYKRLKEIYTYNLFNSIVGRSCVRVLIEDYIMIKYLLKSEAAHSNIWRDYQLYGMGLYKLVLERHKDANTRNDSHFDSRLIETLINEFKNEEFIDMDTRYFDSMNIRQKAENVDEKDLYGLFYDYDSSFEHGLWGAIRESALMICNNPAHKFHLVPDIDDDITLKSVLPDCIVIMNKTLSIIDELYSIPEALLNEALAYES